MGKNLALSLVFRRLFPPKIVLLVACGVIKKIYIYNNPYQYQKQTEGTKSQLISGKQ